MKKRKQFPYNLISQFIIILLIFSLNSIGYAKVHLGIISAVKNKVKQLKDKKLDATKIILGPSTKILADETNNNLSQISQDGLTYIFNNNATQVATLKPGDIIIVTKGDGSLKKITSINTTANGYSVNTTTATLEEAFEKLDVEFSEPLTQSDISVQKAPWFRQGVTPMKSLLESEFSVKIDSAVLFDLDGNENTTYDRIIANGSFSFKINIDGKIVINWFHLDEFKFSSNIKENASIELKSELKNIVFDKEIEIAKFYFVPIIIGPVVFVPEVAIVVGGNGTVGYKVTTSIVQDATYTAGISYKNGKWTPISQLTNNFGFSPPTLLGICNVKGYGGAQSTLKIYGVAGPYIDVDGYLNLRAEASELDFDWILSGGLKGLGGLKVNILGIINIDKDFNIFDWNTVISSGTLYTNTNSSPLNPTLSVTPTNILTPGETTEISCITSDPDGDVLSYSWTSANGTISGSGYIITWTAPISTGTYTIYCNVSDNKGGSASGNVNITVRTYVNPINNSPITPVLTASLSSIFIGGVINISSIASDPDGDTLIYSWTSANGTISGSGNAAIWTAPSTAGIYTIYCSVSDGRGGNSSSSTNINVQDSVNNWEITSLGSLADSYIGYYTSIAFDTNKNAHITYSDFNYDLTYAKWNGNSWVTQIIDSAGSVGDFSSIILDSNNNPHIAYYDYASGNLKYTRWNGNSWIIQTVDSVGSVGDFSSIALDSNNNPHISYYDYANGDLKYAKWNGNSWITQTVDSTGIVGWYTSLSLDTNNNPYISYYDYTNSDLKFAKWTGTNWINQTVDSIGNIGHYTALSLDINNNPYISYYDYTNGDLKFAKLSGNLWNTRTIDSAGDVGRFTALSLDTNNNPYISYYDHTNGDLKFAKWDGTNWSIQIADSTGNVGYYNSIALDANNYPYIIYSDLVQDIIKCVKWK